MNITRNQLYAAGEPLGDCATTRKPGGGLRCGGGGDSSSASTQQTTNVNTDARSVFSSDNHADNRSISDSSQRNWTDNSQTSASWADNSQTSASWADNSQRTSISNSLDGGAINAGRDVSMAALQNNSTNAEHLFDLADTLFAQTTKTLNLNSNLSAELAGSTNKISTLAKDSATKNQYVIYAILAVAAIMAYRAYK